MRQLLVRALGALSLGALLAVGVGATAAAADPGPSTTPAPATATSSHFQSADWWH